MRKKLLCHVGFSIKCLSVRRLASGYMLLLHLSLTWLGFFFTSFKGNLNWNKVISGKC